MRPLFRQRGIITKKRVRATLRVNGKEYKVDVSPEPPLLWVFRGTLGRTGTKHGYGMALCTRRQALQAASHSP